MFTRARNRIVLLCLAALLLAMLIPSAGLLAAILLPLSFLLFVPVHTSLCSIVVRQHKPEGSPFLRELASRPPPAW
jgi:hypothetical protein